MIITQSGVQGHYYTLEHNFLCQCKTVDSLTKIQAGIPSFVPSHSRQVVIGCKVRVQISGWLIATSLKPCITAHGHHCCCRLGEPLTINWKMFCWDPHMHAPSAPSAPKLRQTSTHDLTHAMYVRAVIPAGICSCTHHAETFSVNAAQAAEQAPKLTNISDPSRVLLSQTWRRGKICLKRGKQHSQLTLA